MAEVTFAPQFTGLRKGAVTLEDASGDAFATAFLYGVGTGPQVVFNTPLPPLPRWNFGSGIIYPRGAIAVDGAGNLYFVNGYNLSVIYELPATCTADLYNAGSCTTVQLGGGLSNPFGVAVDGAGNVYVGQPGIDTVTEIPAGCTNARFSAGLCATVELGGGFAGPTPSGGGSFFSAGGVVVDGAGNVYVGLTDSNYNINGAVHEMPAGCTAARFGAGLCQITALGGGFGAAGAGTYTYGLAIDAAGNLFAGLSNQSNNNPNGAVKEIPAGCTTDMYANGDCQVVTLGGGFTRPNGVAVDAAGDVYVAEQYQGDAIRMIPPGCTSANFSAGSCQITLLGSGFTNSGGIAGPWGVALDGAGNVFIADASNYAVSEIPRVESVGLTFPITQVGYASASDTTPPYVTMQNIGTSALTFTPAVATGANPVPAANFALDGSSSSCAQTGADGTPASLASSAACTLVFNFVPTVGGLLSEDALLTDNSLNVAGATQSIPLSGVGVEIVISPTTLTDGVFGTAYSQTLTASGSPTAGATYSFAVTSGSLPPGLSLSTAGVISGVPTAVGSYSFTATATDNTAPVSGGPFTGTRDYTLVVINPADFAVSVAPTSQPALPGTLVSYTVTVTSVTAPFTDQVTLQATITPSGPTASFTPQQVIPGAIGSGATSTMTIHVPVQGARLTPNLGMKAPLTLTALLLPLAAFWRGKKKIRLLVLLLAGLAGFSAMTGCGPGGYFSQPQQSYTIIVTGTSGNLSHSATPVTLTVE